MQIITGDPAVDQAVREALKVVARAKGVSESDALAILISDGLNVAQQTQMSIQSKAEMQATSRRFQALSNVMKNRQQSAMSPVRNIN
ncbi:hypothetical protein [Pelagibius sp. Alg239-R121]|uniref:hypothetical protein n=1 Tax=Pelagibius sp. Alg239-R121 TaxID=2993448 RepID=UPI0024A78289|nr:hypothetical protein [Pelagibius sp. Alg239-R121]